ncbi:MAG: cupin domain-containing protein [Actinomycetota bacterium]|jgi:quercetin dioxygenase-like cupin family protein|nr:cupin domain-containing protein [Actinomycetota bacterium]
MCSTGKWNWSFDDDGIHDYGTHATGYTRGGLVGRSNGAVHTDLALCRLAPGGRINRHVHYFEQCAYVLGGRPVVESNGQRLQLQTGDYVHFPVASPHGWLNPGEMEARWLELSTPQPLPPGRQRDDTYFLPGSSDPQAVLPARLPDPTIANVGTYLGTPPQHEALATTGPARGRAPAGIDTALLAYSGISVKMLVDPNMGAELLTMFMVDYEPGGAAQIHDHPFEEAYFFLEGEIEAEVEGQKMTLGAGDFLFCGVGVLHGFFNTTPGRVRWIETQAPQPPRRHSYRWPAHWAELGSKVSVRTGQDAGSGQAKS